MQAQRAGEAAAAGNGAGRAPDPARGRRLRQAGDGGGMGHAGGGTREADMQQVVNRLPAATLGGPAERRRSDDRFHAKGPARAG